jgi:hypothetical protein
LSSASPQKATPDAVWPRSPIVPKLSKPREHLGGHREQRRLVFDGQHARRCGASPGCG